MVIRLPCVPVLLDASTWQEQERQHQARADALTAGHRARAGRGVAHPVEDFLFQYYRHSPAQLRRWHPGPGVAVAGAAGMPRAQWRFMHTDADGAVSLDAAAFLAARGELVAFVRELLTATLSRPASLGCFGLHEWAMAYRSEESGVRHERWPLRLGHAGTDEVVETHQLRCTHYDAFRFFTPDAVPRNALAPTRDGQRALEQPGCLHAGMDVYKWAFKLVPAVPGDLTLDAFELARDIRVLDMEASPYDLTDLGYAPVPVETAAGKAAYVERQRAFTVRSNALRQRLLTCLGELEAQAQVQRGSTPARSSP
jgi:hypothetical protein